MTEREILVELIADARNGYYDYADELHEKGMSVPESSEEYIADYLIANGVVVMPCKVGDVVYYFSHRPFNLCLQSNTIYEAKVVRIVITSLGTQAVIQIRNEYGCTEVPDIRDFGKTVFLTREDAERALKGVTDKYGGGKVKGGVLDAD